MKIMRTITTLFCAIVLSTFTSVFAQEQTTEHASKAKNNWFISLGGSANLLLAEQDKYQSVEDRLTFGGALSIGKWFNPYMGARIQVVGGSLKGFNFQANHGGQVTDRYTTFNDDSRLTVPMGVINGNDWSKLSLVDGDGQPGFWQEFNYGTAGIDIMANLTNLFKGYYNEKSRWDIIPYVGGGFIRAFGNDVTTPVYSGVFVKAGMMVDFNINSKWAVYLEPQANLTHSEFDGYDGDAVGDAIFNLMLGVQYSINKDFSKPANVSMCEIDRLNTQINEYKGLLLNQQNKIDQNTNKLRELEARKVAPVVEKVVVEKKVLPNYIHFAINSATIQGVERAKIDETIQFLKDNPNAKLQLVGYADKQTGNPAYNLKLSQKRVESVANAIKQGGINADRLMLDWKGDSEQPYADNPSNRVVFIIEK